MFKLRRRTVVAAAVSDLPFCTMCGTTIRVDTLTGRCALGHRVTAVVVPAAPVAADDTAVIETPAANETPAAYEVTESFESFDSFEAPAYDLPATSPVDEPAGGIAGEGLFEAYSTAEAPGRVVSWDDVIAPPATEGGGVYDDYLTWDEPSSGFSSLDVDTDELPVATEADQADQAAEATVVTPLPADLLGELDDDAAHARRRTLGTIGATLGMGLLTFASIAVLPF